jgi:hypothetical protein
MITIPEVSAMLKKEWVTHIKRGIVDDDKLSLGARLTYAILCGYRGKNCKEPFPSLPALSNKLGRCRQKVQSYLDELEAAGILEAEQRRKPDGSWGSNGYQINDGIHGSPQLSFTATEKHRYGET